MKTRSRSGSKLVRLQINVAEDLEELNLHHQDGRSFSNTDKVRLLLETYHRWALKGILNIEMRPAISIVRDHLGESAAIALSQMTSALERASKFKDPIQREEFLEQLEQMGSRVAVEALEIRISDEGILKQMGELIADKEEDIDQHIMTSIVKVLEES